MSASQPRLAVVLPGLGRVRRGAEAALSRIAAGLRDRHGYHVELFGGGSDWPHGLTGHQVFSVARERFERFPRIPALRSDCHYEEMTFALGLLGCRAFRSERFDATLTCSYPYVNWMLQRGGWRNVRHVFSTQNGDWMCRARSAEYRYFAADAVACISRQHVQDIGDCSITRLIPNGVDVGRFTGRPKPAGRPHVLMVGALIDSKNVPAGLDAVEQIPEATVTVVGDGPLRDEVRRRVNGPLAGRARWVQSVPSREMPAVYDGANVLLHMSRDEPFGLVYLEAMASGLTVVCHDGPTQRWVVGECGRLVDTRDPRAVVGAVREAAAAGSSPISRTRVERDWAWDRQVDEYALLFADLLDGREETTLAAELNELFGCGVSR